jgi:hypothetical protein
MKKIVCICAFLIASIGFTVFSQTYVLLVKPIDKDTWGFVNLKGELIIDAKYRKCSPFSKEGLAPIYDPDSKKYYFINLKGEVLTTEISDFKLITPFLIGVPYGFEDGLAAVCQNKKWGFLNPEGKVAIPVKYDEVTQFNAGYARVQLNDKFFVLDKQGVEHPILDARVTDVKSFSENLAPFTSADKKMGFINEEGKIVIEAQYKGEGYFSAGVAWVRTEDDKIGYIDKKGDWVIQPRFAAAKNFDPETGLALVKLGDNWSYSNKNGEVFVPKGVKSSGDYSNGLAWGRTADDKLGFIDSKGEWAIQPQFDAARDFKNNYASVKKDGKWGVIDKQGNWVIQPGFDAIKDVELVEK